MGINKVSVIGLGKLGSCLAACLAYKGFDVLGYDVNENSVELINSGKAPVVEPRLQELIDKSKNNLKATTDPEEIIKKSQITFIIVPTPSKKDGHFSDDYLQSALKSMAPHLKNKKHRHMFVVTSTVSPSTTEENLIPLIEKYSGKKLNKHFGVCYNPEFIALGDVVNGILNPDMVLIGESDKAAGDQLEKVYKKLCDNSPYIARMSLVSAEISKIALNAFVTTKISFANTLGNICERIRGADVDAITKALGADKRISPHYLKAALPFSGPCFPRDNKAFVAFAQKFGIDAKLAKATDEVNDFQMENLLNKINEVIKKHKYKSVSILGLSYKTKTGVIDESPAIKKIHKLIDSDNSPRRIKINVYDHLAMKNTMAVFGDKISYASSIKECLDQSPFWIIASPEEEFKKISKKDIKHNNTTIIDCWRMLDAKKLGDKANYLSLGGNFYERN